jgi:hypothetical protein
MRLVRLLGTRRLLVAQLLLCFGLYGIESEVADVHHGELDAVEDNSAHRTDPGVRALPTRAGKYFEAARKDAACKWSGRMAADGGNAEGRRLVWRSLSVLCEVNPD